MPGPEQHEPHPYHGVLGILYGIRVAIANVWGADIPWWRQPSEVVSNIRLRMSNGWVCCGSHGHPGC